MGTRLLAIAFVIIALNGCSILEEINKLGGEKVATEEVGDNCVEGSASEACATKPRNAWLNIKSLSSHDMKADIVRCDVGAALQFTTREICLARGGTPAGL